MRVRSHTRRLVVHDLSSLGHVPKCFLRPVRSQFYVSFCPVDLSKETNNIWKSDAQGRSGGVNFGTLIWRASKEEREHNERREPPCIRICIVNQALEAASPMSHIAYAVANIIGRLFVLVPLSSIVGAIFVASPRNVRLSAA